MDSKRISVDELTGLRGLAALFIIINHTCLLLPRLKETVLFPALGSFGIMGMDLFFILSGFVIHYNYCRKLRNCPPPEILNFLKARFSRLYPLYFAFIIGMFMYNVIKYWDNTLLLSRDLATLPTFLAGMQSWFYSFVGDYPVIYCQENANISWSISTEFALYLFFIPLAIWAFNIKNIKHCFFLLFTTIVCNALWVHFNFTDNILTRILNHFTTGTSEIYNANTWLYFHSPFARILQFLSGCLISEIFINKNSEQKGKIYKYIILFSTICMLCYILLVQYFPAEYKHIVSSLILTILVMAAALGGNKFLKSKGLIFLGEISYSTYLLHIIFIQIFQYKGEHMISYVLNLLGFIVCTYLVSYFTYKYYEVPARKKVKEFLSM